MPVFALPYVLVRWFPTLDSPWAGPTQGDFWLMEVAEPER
jgi:hypothetical protein